MGENNRHNYIKELIKVVGSYTTSENYISASIPNTAWNFCIASARVSIGVKRQPFQLIISSLLYIYIYI